MGESAPWGSTNVLALFAEHFCWRILQRIRADTRVCPYGESIGLMLRGFVGANPRVRPFCRTSGQTHGSAPTGINGSAPTEKFKPLGK
jgi:hypothetical protein